MELARRAANRFGAADQLDALEAAIGAPSLVKLFADIGEAMGEDGAVGQGRGGFAMTAGEARTEIARMESDTETLAILADKLHPAHRTTKDRRSRLFQAAYPGMRGA